MFEAEQGFISNISKNPLLLPRRKYKKHNDDKNRDKKATKERGAGSLRGEESRSRRSPLGEESRSRRSPLGEESRGRRSPLGEESRSRRSPLEVDPEICRQASNQRMSETE